MEYIKEKPMMENADVLEAPVEKKTEDTAEAAKALENVVAKTTVEELATKKAEEAKQEAGFVESIKGFFDKRKLKKFKEATSKRMNSFKSKGYRLPAGGEEELWAQAKADGYQGNLGIDQKNNTIRYIPTAEITYSGNENSKAGPTAGA